MIITIGSCLIATLLVLANYKYLRKPRIFIFTAVLAAGLFATGLVLALGAGDNPRFYSAFLSPLIALFLLLFSRTIFRRKHGLEMIVYMYGFYPVRHEERFVSRLEKTITFLITMLSVALPIIGLSFIS